MKKSLSAATKKILFKCQSFEIASSAETELGTAQLVNKNKQILDEYTIKNIEGIIFLLDTKQQIHNFSLCQTNIDIPP